MTSAFEPLVLCYHRVSTRPPHRLVVSSDALERHLRAVAKRGYAAGSAADVVAGRGRVFHVTFDDAFRSVRDALPVLGRLGAPATVFACTDYADDGRPLDIPELAASVREAPEEFATLRWDELRELVERGIEIGSHTRTHPHLPALGDDAIRRELRDSRARIEDELGVPCRYLAYPFGQEDARVRSAARDAGYEAAFAVPGRRRPLDPMRIPRVDLYWRDDGLRARLKLSSAFWWRYRSRP